VLAVRPENVSLEAEPAPPDAVNRIPGRVALVAYLGGTLRYDVAVGEVVVKADIRDAWHHERLPLGAPVTLSFPASVTLALPHES
jgi:hypothetical protein